MRKTTRKQDWLDLNIRNLVGSKPNADEVLLLRLLDAKATSQKRAIPLSDFALVEMKPLARMKEKGWIAVTEGWKIYLTKLGVTIAKGAKKIYL